jgi:hypothetical protein
MNVPRIISGKPPLFHYTSLETLIKIMESGSLLARPTWDFEDTAEYVLGLKYIDEYLKNLYSRKQERREIPVSTLMLLAKYGVDLRSLIDQTIAHIGYEIEHYVNPRAEVYVACLTEHPQSNEMARAYGESVINFNQWMLPLIAYAHPRPFSWSMLSRVTYNRKEFESYLMGMGFNIGEANPGPLKQFLDPLNVEERTASLAGTAAILLCSFACNIKNQEFDFEKEWRLKTCRLNHTTPTLFSSDTHGMREWFELGADAQFTDHQPKRYKQELTFKGAFIVQNQLSVCGLAPVPPDFIDRFGKFRTRMEELEKQWGGLLGPALGLRDAILKRARENKL